jgi:ferrous iron transport protein A
MMPLTLTNDGEEAIVRHIGGSPDVKRHLEDLGFVPGENVRVISRIGGNVIVVVKDTRLAIDQAMAAKIMV